MEDSNQASPARVSGSGTRENPLYSEQERIAAYQRYIFRGGRLIADGKYAEAIGYFRNQEQAKKAGLSFTLAREALIDTILPDQVESVANQVAANSWFLSGEKRINPSGVHIGGRRLNDIPDSQMTPAEKSLAHEVALVHMEEFLHGLQYLRGGPIAGFVDNEVDVAAYMQRNGIPLTPAFLRRYDRGAFLTGKDSGDDSMISRPAFRRGVFVNVRRSSGAIENDWQITGFDVHTGEAVVRNYSQEVEKRLTREELAAVNSEGTNPFTGCRDFTDIFPLIDRFKKIHATLDVYEAEELKKLINRVRLGEEDINTIPRSGGLRLKVAELLNLDASAVISAPTLPLG